MSVNQKRGVSWTLLSTLSGAVLQTLQLAMTVRYLSTTEVGVLAIVNVLIAIANMLKDFGLSSFLIHRQELSQREQSTLFWLTITIGIIIASFVFSIAPLASSFYAMPELENLLYLSAINILIIASCSQWQALMVKTFQFVGLAKIELITKLLGFISIVVYLKMGLGYFSPVFAMLTTNVASFFLLFFVNRQRFTPSFHWEHQLIRQAFGYGMYQVGGQFLNQVRANLDTLLIGKFLGPSSVGLYSVAKELILRPSRLIQPVVSRFALPSFATIQNNPNQQGRLYIQTCTILVGINGAIYTTLLILAEPITYLLFGKSLSQQVTPFLQILTMFGFIRCIGGPMGVIAQANGRTDIEFRWNVISTVFFSMLLYLAVQESLLVTTLAMSLGQIIMTTLSYFLLLKPVCAVPFKSFLKLGMPVVVCMLIQATAFHLLTLDTIGFIALALISYVLYLSITFTTYKQLWVMLRR